MPAAVRRTVVVVVLGAAVPLAGPSCAAPMVREDGAAACANGEDDDGDGLTDCKDPGCASSDACESSPPTCADGRDNDGDGLVDCQDQSCRDVGACATFDAECDPGSGTGCPVGMSCYPQHAGSPVCAVPGAGVEGGGCGAGDDPTMGCGAHLVCGGDAPGACYAMCNTNEDCPRSSLCIPSLGGKWGVCSLLCMPEYGCTGGGVCLPLQRFGVALERGGFLHSCISGATYAASYQAGRATEGAPCAEAVDNATPATRICAVGFLCVPDPDPVCRPVCAVPDGPTPRETCRSGRCVVVDPFDARPPRSTEGYRVGICLP